MGRKIMTNHKDSWSIYSTISEGVMAKFKNEKELKKFIALEHISYGKLDAIKELMLFPNGWTINDNLEIRSSSEYLNWYNKILEETKTYDEYFEAIDAKLNELLNL